SILRPSSSRCRPQWLTAVVCVLVWVISIVFMAAVTSLCMLHEHEQCERAFIATFTLSSLLFVPPMVISNVILWTKVLCGSQRRQPRMPYIVIFFTDLYFLLFAIPFRIFIFIQEFIQLFMSFKVVFLLAGMYSSMSPFIYFLVGSCRRPCSFVSLQVAFQRVFEEPEDNSAHRKQIAMDTLDPPAKASPPCGSTSLPGQWLRVSLSNQLINVLSVCPGVTLSGGNSVPARRRGEQGMAKGGLGRDALREALTPARSTGNTQPGS
ncbi:PREDICTED: mas-related G-protein coupled receptor member H-like, partial [Buceros rhinoceros silvestris]|uniref:mas-related G-protein coupled receptor member H-like n=1 Tax=Buceros rhinoceros silvestris TaxID=175836 RepID=UPI000528DE29